MAHAATEQRSRHRKKEKRQELVMKSQLEELKQNNSEIAEGSFNSVPSDVIARKSTRDNKLVDYNKLVNCARRSVMHKVTQDIEKKYDNLTIEIFIVVRRILNIAKEAELKEKTDPNNHNQEEVESADDKYTTFKGGIAKLLDNELTQIILNMKK